MSLLDINDDRLRAALLKVRRIALIGASDKAGRPAHEVMEWLLHRGYDVRPVNPRLQGTRLFDRTVVGHLSEIDGPVDMLDLFVNSDMVSVLKPDLMQSAAPLVWMQMGVVNADVAEALRAAGRTVVMNRCPKVDIPRLQIPAPR